MVFYFTATGNSLYIARELEDNPISIPQMLKQDKLDFTDERIGIVTPIYTGELPKLVQDFLKKATFQTPYFYFILTYGNDDTVAAKWSFDFAKKCGIKVDYIHTIKMVDNYLPVFDMSEQMKIDKQEENELIIIKTALKEKKLEIPKVGAKAKLVYKVVKKMQAKNPKLINGEALEIRESCTGCGICAQICPENNLQIEADKAIRVQETCGFCLACIQNCPSKAIRLSIDEPNENARYRNVHVTLEEIIAANNQKM